MTIHGCCPKCGNEIPHNRFIDGHAICSCGWFDDRVARRAIARIEKKTILAMIAGAVILVAGFFHLSNWGSDAISFPLMKIQQMTGTLSDQGFEQLAEICLARGKYECARKAYMGRFAAHSNAQGLAQLGKLDMQLGRNDDALKAYAGYFQAGGADIESAYLNGKLLESANRFDEAMHMYELAAEKSEATLPVLSTSAIVRLLIKQGLYEDAYARIRAFHESGDQAKGYLNTELAQLEAHFQVTKTKKNPRRPLPKGAGKRVAGV